MKFLVEWDEDSHKQRANAVTVDVSHSGCIVNRRRAFAPDNGQIIVNWPEQNYTNLLVATGSGRAKLPKGSISCPRARRGPTSKIVKIWLTGETFDR